MDSDFETVSVRFRDRAEAGRILAARLRLLQLDRDAVILALPRGGVPVAYEVAKEFGLPLDVFNVRKLGVPGQEELAFGAIAAGGTIVFNDSIVNSLQLSGPAIRHVIDREQIELERREARYRSGKPKIEVGGKTVIVVDDGLATGATMRAAVAALGKMNPARIVVAVPVAAPKACDEFDREGCVCVCAATPEPYYGVGMWYDDFRQISDAEVLEIVGSDAIRRS